MPLAQPLAVLRQQLEAQLRDNQLPEALNALLEQLPDGSEKHRIVSALIARLNAANKERFRNTIALDQYQRRVDQVSADFFDLLHDLTEADFDVTAKPTANGKTAKRGSVLYRVPHVMPLQKPTRCTIRVAVDEDAILENILLDEHVEIKSHVEISDVMSAELVDPEGSTFRINPLNARTQLVRDTGYTEWIFNVTPLIEGAHQLLVKVSIMEIVPGFPDPIPREVSVMETVTIVTESAATDDMTPVEFKPSGESFAFQSTSTEAGMYEVSYSKEAEPMPMEAVPEQQATGRGLRALAVFLAFIVLAPVATWAFAPEIPAWVNARYIQDTPEAYAKFIEKFPDSRRREKAYFYKAEASGLLADFLVYQDSFPQGEFENKVLNMVASLERMNKSDSSDFGKGGGGTAGSDGEGPNPFGKNNGGGGIGGGDGEGSDVSVGGGLAGRAVVRRGKIVASPQKQGKVVIEVCVDRNGNVVSAQYTPRGSTTKDSELRDKAISSAQDYKFAPSANAKECGTITFSFGLKSLSDSGTDAAPSDGVTSSHSVTTPGRTALPSGTDDPSNGTQRAAKTTAANDATSKSTLTDPLARTRRSGVYNMVRVEGGTFTMGSPESEAGRTPEECPHSVSVRSFSIGKYEVTQADWREIMGSDPPKHTFKGCDDCPVEGVSWNDIQDFLKKLNTKYPGKNYRLPAEEEWEYAAKGGNRSKGYRYSGSNDLKKVAWYAENSDSKTHRVGELSPNELDIYDMSGNVYEWCHSKYVPYPGCSDTMSSHHVLRGGSWDGRAQGCRTAYRGHATPGGRVGYVGFRLASSPQ